MVIKTVKTFKHLEHMEIVDGPTHRGDVTVAFYQGSQRIKLTFSLWDMEFIAEIAARSMKSGLLTIKNMKKRIGDAHDSIELE
jgi:hypothetical protein